MTARPTQSVAQKTAAGAAWIIAWRMVTRNLGLVSTLILVRLLRPEDFGLVALATGFISSVDALFAVGVQDALIRLPRLDRDLYDTGFGLNILRGVLTCLLILAIAWPTANFFNEPHLVAVMLALAAGALIGGFENIGTVDFRRNLIFRKEFIMQSSARFISVIVTIVTASIWPSYWALVVGILTAKTTSVVLSYGLSDYRPGFTLRAWRQIIGFSLWIWAGAILFQIQERMESVVIGRALGMSRVGVFAVGAELGLLPTTELVEPLARALFSGFASLHDDIGGRAKVFVDAIAIGFMLVLPASVGISMIADPVVKLCLGVRWEMAIPVVQIVAFSGITTICTHAAANLINVMGLPNVTFYAGLITSFVKLTGLLLLVAIFGLIGASYALVISSVVVAAILMTRVLPKANISFSKLIKCFIRPTISTLVMVAVLWLLDMAWTPAAGTDALGFGKDVMARTLIGIACYGLGLSVAWNVAGRPDGPERVVLIAMGTIIRRFIASFKGILTLFN